MKNLHLISFILVLFATGCKPYFKATDFEQVTEDHTTVAILPFELFTVGHVPAKLTPEMIAEIEEVESTTFQSSFYNKVLSSTQRGRGQLRVGMQHYTETNSLLEQNGITVRESWSMSPKKLANVLGVDAVVKARIEKNQYFSDGLSAGIDIAETIFTILTDTTDPFYVSDNNKKVTSDYSLVDSDGITLWSIGYNNSSDWREQADQLVSQINHRSSRHFPYRQAK